MQHLLGKAKVWGASGTKDWTLYYDDSAQNHVGSDDETLRSELQKALNLAGHAVNGTHKVRVNNGKGYIVYKIVDANALQATIFHYHWNYNLDLAILDT